ncbi:unnamed protein product, partial [Mesorhabditis belari]|uniref:tRNA-intron lyase n=1 Tax=Mesorhabditis belari TaxID=2138241 RepID=A0AAF3FHW6_9BILA
MDLLKFDRKKGTSRDFPMPHLIEHAEVDVWGGIGVVSEERKGQILHKEGGFGHYLGEGFRRAETSYQVSLNFQNSSACSEPKRKRARQNGPSNGTQFNIEEEPPCQRLPEKNFADAVPETLKNCSTTSCEQIENDIISTNSEHDEEKLATFKQLRSEMLKSIDKRLRLGPEELVYLTEANVITSIYKEQEMNILDLWAYLCQQHGKYRLARRFALYLHLREIGWIPRSGISFGADYLIYKDGAEYYHASAAVKILDTATPLEIGGLNRELFNVRKSLIIAKVTVPRGVDCSDFAAISDISVELETQSTFMPGRNFE